MAAWPPQPRSISMYLLHACHSFWSQEAEIELSKPCSVIAHFFLNHVGPHVNHAYHARLKCTPIRIQVHFCKPHPKQVVSHFEPPRAANGEKVAGCLMTSQPRVRLTSPHFQWPPVARTPGTHSSWVMPRNS